MVEMRCQLARRSRGISHDCFQEICRTITGRSYEKYHPTCATSCPSALPIRSHLPAPSRRARRGSSACPARPARRLSSGGTAPPSWTCSSCILAARGSGDWDRCHWGLWQGCLSLGRSTNIDPASRGGRRSCRISNLFFRPVVSRESWRILVQEEERKVISYSQSPIQQTSLRQSSRFPDWLDSPRRLSIRRLEINVINISYPEEVRRMAILQLTAIDPNLQP